MAKRTKGTKKKGSPRTWHIGMLKVNPFGREVPIFTSSKAYMAEAASLGYEVSEPDGSFLGYLSIIEDEDGYTRHAIIFHEDARFHTWVHEISHLIDYVFKHCGVPSGIESTEVRAYLMNDLLIQLQEIMHKHDKRGSKKKAA